MKSYNMKRLHRRLRRTLGVESLELKRCLTTAFSVSELTCCDAGEVRALEVGDINGDGAADVIVSSMDLGIAWYPRTGDTLGARAPVADGITAIQVIAVDIDSDNDTDIVAGITGDNDGEIVWYENTGGTFAEAQLIAEMPRGNFDVQVGDLNGDDKVDVVWASPNADSIAWQANDGTGAFGAAQEVWDGFERAMDVEVADIDGDGDMDIVGASFSFLDPKVSWFRNDGTGDFVEEMDVAQGVGSPWSIDAGDIDGDGDLDVVVSSYRGGLGEAYKVVNEAGGDFAEPEIIDQIPALAEVNLVDVDNDNAADLLATTTVGKQRAEWYRSLGNGSFEASRLLPVQTVGMSTIAVTDFNGDGRNDIISNVSENGRLILSESRLVGDSNGDGVFDSSDIIAAFVAGLYETGQPASFDEGDWNGDGIFDTSDLVTAFQAGIYVPA